ncbi:hypothetical protein CDAR_562581 [Caerostris darwini]|uniref:Uncharacterized protein n=1 Tax=Caerostris darwini TaxID=1538125 RepID=A0AAV4X7J4_9ARAC|nr:hypothetical protein CDAR_562581 [Caerostris darwini]
MNLFFVSVSRFGCDSFGILFDSRRFRTTGKSKTFRFVGKNGFEEAEAPKGVPGKGGRLQIAPGGVDEIERFLKTLRKVAVKVTGTPFIAWGLNKT